MTLQSSELYDGRTQKERDSDHRERYGHQALYSHHTCRECGLEWHCRQPSCKLEREGVLCRQCEIEALLDYVVLVGKEIDQYMKITPEGESIWGASLRLGLQAKLKGLTDDAIRVMLMEKI